MTLIVFSKKQLATLNSSDVFGIRLWIVIVSSAAICTAIVLLIVLFLCICCDHRKSKDKASTIVQSGVARPTDNCANKTANLSTKQYNSRQCRWFSMKEITEVTDKFHTRNLVGLGRCGTVYRGFLADGTPVAVKELSCTSLKTEQFRTLVEAIPSMTHKNLVKLIGFSVEEWAPRTRYIVVSEYVDNGNLYQWLHSKDDGNFSPLTWRIRMDIISGIAKGLAYMHGDVEPKMVHTRLQSHKIMLDRLWNPKISDFSVARLSNAMFNVPDIASNLPSDKEDVYNFGIILMEIITGRMPVDNNRPREEQQLAIWLKSMVSNSLYEQVLDPKLPEFPPPKELKRVLLIALRCTDPDEANRPKMGQVIHMLEPRDLLLSDVKNAHRQSFSGSCTSS